MRVVLLAVLILGLAPPTVAAETCPSLQAIVDATPPGGTAVFPACRYETGVQVDRDITIRGDGGVVEGPGAVAFEAAIWMSGGDLVVEDVTFKGWRFGVRLFEEGARTTIRNATFLAASDAEEESLAIEVYESQASLEVRGSRFETGEAVRTLVLGGPTLDGVTAEAVPGDVRRIGRFRFEDNTVAPCGSGGLRAVADDAVVARNTFAGRCAAHVYSSVTGDRVTVAENALGASIFHADATGRLAFVNNTGASGRIAIDSAGIVAGNTLGSIVTLEPREGTLLVERNSFTDADVVVQGRGVVLRGNAFARTAEARDSRGEEVPSLRLLEGSAGNRLYLNDFLDVAVQDHGRNRWSAGDAGPGNHWSRFAGQASVPVPGAGGAVDRFPVARPGGLDSPDAPAVVASAVDVRTTVGVPTVLDASGSYVRSGPGAFRFDLGDGSTAEGAVVTHAWKEVGVYSARLEVAAGGVTDAVDFEVEVCPDLQAMLDAAPAGADVLAPACTYATGVRIERPVTLRADPPGSARFVASLPGAVAVTVAADDVTLRGLAFDGWATAVLARERKDLVVENASFTGEPVEGRRLNGVLHAAHMDGVTVRGSRFATLPAATLHGDAIRFEDNDVAACSTGESAVSLVGSRVAALDNRFGPCDRSRALRAEGGDLVVHGNALGAGDVSLRADGRIDAAENRGNGSWEASGAGEFRDNVLGTLRLETTEATLRSNAFRGRLTVVSGSVVVERNLFAAADGRAILLADDTRDSLVVENEFQAVQAVDHGTGNRWWDAATGRGNRWADLLGPDDDADGVVDVGHNVTGELGRTFVADERPLVARPEGVPDAEALAATWPSARPPEDVPSRPEARPRPAPEAEPRKVPAQGVAALALAGAAWLRRSRR